MGAATLCSTRGGLDSLSRLFDVLARYALAGLLILLGNTLVGLGEGTLLYLLTLCVAVVIVVVNWVDVALTRREAAAWFIWAIIVLGAYISVFFVTGDGRGGYGLLSTGFLIICPLMIALLAKSGKLGGYLRAFVNLTALLAVISLALWVAGPITGVISDNCSISTTWTGSGERVLRPGYFHLLYVTQTSDLFDFPIVRNTGIFAEAPMYSYVLCMALLFEMVLSERPRKVVALILLATVATTLSTTGIVFILAISYVLAAYKSRDMRSNLRPIFIIVLALVLIIVTFASFSLLDQKLGTTSGSIRLDDFRAGFLAWSERPIFGYGLGDTDALTLFMSGFRSFNQGFSNSLFDLLVRGGLVFAFPFLIAMAGYLLLSKRVQLAGLLFLYLWIITIVTFQPLTYLMFGVGVVGLMRGADGLNAESSTVRGLA